MCKGPEVGPLSPQDAQTDKLGPVGMMLRREMSGDMEQRAKPQGSRHLSVGLDRMWRGAHLDTSQPPPPLCLPVLDPEQPGDGGAGP